MILEKQKVDEFEVEEIIGEGAFGRVYRAYDKLLDRPVAIKELRDKLSLDKETIQRFIQEIHILSLLHKPIDSRFTHKFSKIIKVQTKTT